MEKIFIVFRLPFEWKNPSTFLIAYFIQFPTVYYLILTAGCSLNVLIVSCIILIAFVKDIKNDLEYLKENKLDETKLLKKLIEFIDFHAKIKQLVYVTIYIV